MTEATLIEQAKRGDRRAFRELVLLHRKSVFAVAFDLTGSAEEAEDLSQEVFLKMYRSLDHFRSEAKLSTWLYRIAVNTWITMQRRGAAKLRAREDTMNGEDEMAYTIADIRPDADPSVTAEVALLNERIKRALETLTPRERAVFVLRHYQDLKIADVGIALGISEGTVKSLLFRALGKLRNSLTMYRLNMVEGEQP
jgi:RNA polymerase sigma-70 factor, ECF subfamily